MITPENTTNRIDGEFSEENAIINGEFSEENIRIVDMELSTTNSNIETELSSGNSEIDVQVTNEDRELDMENQVFYDTEVKDYNLLYNKPQINDVTLQGNKTSDDLGLQDKLVSGVNLKTVNEETLLGSGNISIYDIWWAKYQNEGVTSTYDEIKIHADIYKKIFLEWENRIYSLTNNGSNLFFESVQDEYVYILRCTNQNVWSSSRKKYSYDDTELRNRIADLEAAQIIMNLHMANTNIHTNPTEKRFWNDKLNVYYNIEDLTFNRS